jgi:twitching motility two-component system response regulator PilG
VAIDVLTGKKLLLADDSAAIQKVIDLTFSDEGMKVTTVGDGRAALSELEQFPVPDVVLADASMPEMGGFELCQIIKRDDRFSTIPVVLLISSFEPFDEAQARAAGADDVVSKPFQSIRDLVSRVGSLLGSDSPTHDKSPDDHSMLGLSHSQPQVNVVESTSDANQETSAEPNVTVLVEAQVMDHPESTEAAGATCVADIELQTADTKKLERITDEPDAGPPQPDAQFQDAVEVEPVNDSSSSAGSIEDAQFQDTVEVEPVDYSAAAAEPPTIETEEPEYSQFAETTEIFTQPSVETIKSSDEGLLELDDAFEETISDDVSLDLDFGAPLPSAVSEKSAPAPHVHAGLIAETKTATEAVAVLPEPPVPGSDATAIALEAPAAHRDVAPAGTLPAEAIEAIARRVVEQMSDRVVREIAWEVVPELSELLIKKKLDEQK